MKDYLIQVDYWLATSKRDYKTMIGLFGLKRYSESLFFGHIILEKALKALVVQKTKEIAPKIHNLETLAFIAGLKLGKDDLDFLNVVSRFNIRARYPSYKFDFYKLCTREYTEDKLSEIKKLYSKLCQKVKRKK